MFVYILFSGQIRCFGLGSHMVCVTGGEFCNSADNDVYVYQYAT